MDYFYLDIGPMIRRLRQNPTEFELRHDCIHHRPSGHRLILIRDSKHHIVARCNGVEFPIIPEQSSILRAALANWEEVYWHPLIARKIAGRRITQISRELARLSEAKAQWRKIVRAIFAWFDISARQQQRRSSRPNLRVISSLSEDTELASGAPPAPQSSREKQLSA